jgi:hypothetical protein
MILSYPSIIYGDRKTVDLYKQPGKGGFKAATVEKSRWILKDCNFLEPSPEPGKGVSVTLLRLMGARDYAEDIKRHIKKNNIGSTSGKIVAAGIGFTVRPVGSFDEATLRSELDRSR